MGRLATARVARTEHLRRPRRPWTLGVIALPVVLILVLPPATLARYALGPAVELRRDRGRAPDIVSGPIVFVDIAAAQSVEAAAWPRCGRAPASRSRWRGSSGARTRATADEFLLTRFVVTCCVADATSAQVRVVNVPPGRFAPDDWVRVTGTHLPAGHEILVDASTVGADPAAGRPYLTP